MADKVKRGYSSSPVGLALWISRQKLPWTNLGRLAPRLQLPGPLALPSPSRFHIWLAICHHRPSTTSPSHAHGHARALSCLDESACYLPLPLWRLLLEKPAPCVFHIPSFDATALRGLAARPPSLPPALFSAAMATMHHALSETEQCEGANWPRIAASSTILLHNSGFLTVSSRNSLHTEAGVTNLSFKNDLESIYCSISLESDAGSNFP